MKQDSLLLQKPTRAGRKEKERQRPRGTSSRRRRGGPPDFKGLPTND